MKPSIVQLQQLIGNRKAYAVQQPDGSYRPVTKPLTPSVLAQHRARKMTVGTYINAGTKARTLVFDIDSGVDSQEYKEILTALRELGIPERSVGTEFTGSKGYHVWVVLAQYVEASDLRRVGRATLALAGVSCEVNPKQDEAKNLGNLVKLPGGIHQVTKKTNDFIDRIPQPMTATHLKTVLAKLPEEPKISRYEPVDGLRCMTVAQEGLCKGGRNRGLFQLATMLRRSGVAEEHTEHILRQSALRAKPPVDEDEVQSILRSSRNSGPICTQLPEESRCEECPVMRGKGLYCKPGQLKHGAEGELLVVTMGRSKGKNQRELEHPDIEQAIARLK